MESRAYASCKDGKKISLKSGVEIDDCLIKKKAKFSPMVYSKYLLSSGEILIGFAMKNSFGGTTYLRKHQVVVSKNHEYSKLKLYDELNSGFRIRRIETTDSEVWYEKTKKVDVDRPIYYYYELSSEPDKCFRTFRWARKKTEEYRSACAGITSLSELKQRRNI